MLSAFLSYNELKNLAFLLDYRINISNSIVLFLISLDYNNLLSHELLICAKYFQIEYHIAYTD